METLADDLGKSVKNLGQVAAGSMLDIDGDHEILQVLQRQALGHVQEGVTHIQTIGHLVHGKTELGADGIGHLLGHQRHRGAERMTGAQTPDDEVKRVGELLQEPLETRPLPVHQVQDGQTDARYQGDEQGA